jgi:serine/threonine-protein kinase
VAFPEVEGYRVVACIGLGGMGEVYLAEQEGFGRPVAIKLLRRDRSSEEARIVRFELEMKLMAKLHHPSIVRPLRWGRTRDGRLFLSMEYVRGANLREIIVQGRYSTRQRIGIVLQAAEALAHAHAADIVHRTVVPENMIVQEPVQGLLTLKLMDFGAGLSLESDPLQPRITREGTFIGVPLYMSPEQRLSPKSVDVRTDIYSLGMVFYELLTGDIPVGRYFPPSQRSPGLGLAYDQIVRRMLEADLCARYPRMTLVVADILAAAVSRGPPKTENEDSKETR